MPKSYNSTKVRIRDVDNKVWSYKFRNNDFVIDTSFYFANEYRNQTKTILFNYFYKEFLKNKLTYAKTNNHI